MRDFVQLVDADVIGKPAPKGSKRHVGNGVMVESSKQVKPWQEAVKAAVLGNRRARAENGAVSVAISFRVDRPRSHYLPANSKRPEPILRADAPERPAAKPDVDKLVRSTLDALKDVGVYRDDSQVADLYAFKHYTKPGEVPGARIIVRSIP